MIREDGLEINQAHRYSQVDLLKVSNDRDHPGNVVRWHPSFLRGDPTSFVNRRVELDTYDHAQAKKTKAAKEKRDVIKRKHKADAAALAHRALRLKTAAASAAAAAAGSSSGGGTAALADPFASLGVALSLAITFCEVATLCAVAAGGKAALNAASSEAMIRASRFDFADSNLPIVRSAWGTHERELCMWPADKKSLLARAEGAAAWKARHEAFYSRVASSSLDQAASASSSSAAAGKPQSDRWHTWWHPGTWNKIVDAVKNVAKIERSAGGSGTLSWQQKLFCCSEPSLALRLPSQHWHLSDLRMLARLADNSHLSADELAKLFLKAAKDGAQDGATYGAQDGGVGGGGAAVTGATIGFPHRKVPGRGRGRDQKLL